MKKIVLTFLLSTYFLISQPRLHLSIQVEDQQFLLINSKGLKVGYDRLNKTTYREIPYLVYSDEGLSIDDEETGKVSHYKPLWTLTFRNSSFDSLFTENYTIILQGEKLHTYAGGIYSLIDNKEFYFSINGIIDSGQFISYKFVYSSLTNGILAVTKSVNSNSIAQDINNFTKLNLITNRGIANSLQQKIENAGKQKDKGDVKAAVNLLQAFINEVTAQKEKAITKEAAVLLLEDAEQLKTEWSRQ